jgi:type III secretory pathway component EscV
MKNLEIVVFMATLYYQKILKYSTFKAEMLIFGTVLHML